MNSVELFNKLEDKYKDIIKQINKFQDIDNDKVSFKIDKVSFEIEAIQRINLIMKQMRMCISDMTNEDATKYNAIVDAIKKERMTRVCKFIFGEDANGTELDN